MPALSDKTKLIKQQAILIQHALLCRGTCSLPFCDVMKTVIAHMGECQPGIKCAVRHCASSRAIFGHVKDCKKSTCPVCEPFATINDTQIENVEDKSLALWMQVVGPGSMNASTVERAVNTSSAFNGSMMETSFLDTSFGGAPDTQAMPSEREESATTATGSETSGQQSRANCAPAKGVPTTNGPRSAEVLNKAGPAAEKPTKSQHAIVAGSKPAREKANKMASPSGPPSANKKPAEKNAKPKEKQPATKRPSTGTATKANTTSEDVPANDVSSIDMPDLADEPSVDQPVTLEATSFLGGPLNMTHMNATASDASFSQINLVQSTPMVSNTIAMLQHYRYCVRGIFAAIFSRHQ